VEIKPIPEWYLLHVLIGHHLNHLSDENCLPEIEIATMSSAMGARTVRLAEKQVHAAGVRMYLSSRGVSGIYQE
jgi:hypothetical protein